MSDEVEIGDKTVMPIHERLKMVVFGDWNLQRHYRFQILSLMTLTSSSFLAGISIAGILINNLPKPFFIGFQITTAFIVGIAIWKLQKEDEKMRRLDAVVQGLNSEYATEQILDEDDERKPYY